MSKKKNIKSNNDSHNSPKDYDRWGKVGVKVISKPQQPKKKVKRA